MGERFISLCRERQNQSAADAPLPSRRCRISVSWRNTWNKRQICMSLCSSSGWMYPCYDWPPPPPRPPGGGAEIPPPRPLTMGRWLLTYASVRKERGINNILHDIIQWSFIRLSLHIYKALLVVGGIWWPSRNWQPPFEVYCLRLGPLLKVKWVPVIYVTQWMNI